MILLKMISFIQTFNRKALGGVKRCALERLKGVKKDITL